MSTLLNDIRYAGRRLIKSPGFTGVVILTLALGIGATTAVYSVARTVLFDPLPVSNPDRFVRFFRVHKAQGRTVRRIQSPVAVDELRKQTDLFARLCLYEHDDLQLQGRDFPETVWGLKVTPEFFSLWTVRPLLGRVFAEGEGKAGQDQVMVLSHRLWQSRFGGDPGIIGRTISFTDQTFTVVGVMPPYFSFPRALELYWRPYTGPVLGNNADGSLDFGTHSTGVIAELHSDVRMPQVQAYLDVLSPRLTGEDGSPWPYALRVGALSEMFVKPEVRRTLWALLSAVSLTLLVVCANVANLQIARTEARQTELAVRAAIGARRWRLIRQLFTENLLLAGAGGVAGLVLTGFGLTMLVKLIPPELPQFKPISLDLGVLALASVVSLAAGVLFGLLPAWSATRSAVGETLKGALTRGTRGIGQAKMSRILVVGQVALVFVLLTGTGLMARSVVALLTVNPGFDPHNLVEVYPGLDFSRFPYGSEEELAGHLGHLQERVAALPGVEEAGFSVLDDGDWLVYPSMGGASVELQSHLIGVGQTNPLTVMRVPLVKGRWLDRHEALSVTDKVLLNETAARTLWPGADAVGKRFWVKSNQQEGTFDSFQVVGVVGDIRLNRFDELPRPAAYRAAVGGSEVQTTLLVRTTVRPETVYASIAREFKAAGADALPPFFLNIQERLYDATSGHRTLLMYLAIFAGVGLLLSAVGIYAVLAFSVARRTREIGIRMALGATRRELVRLIVTQGMYVVAIGVAVGLFGTLATNRLLRSFLFGLGPSDPATYVSVVLLVGVVALVACWLPARRAARVHPTEALRYE